MNLSQDYSGLFLAKLVREPLFWPPVMFAVIAPVGSMTERYNVGRNSSRAVGVRKWNPVIHCQGVKQAALAIAYSAAPAEIIKGKLPILFGKFVRESGFARCVTLLNKPKLIASLHSVLLAGSLGFVGISLVPFLGALISLWVSTLLLPFGFTPGFQIAQPPSFVIPVSIETMLFGVTPGRFLFTLLVLGFPDISAVTRLAFGGKSRWRLLGLVEMFFGCWESFLTAGAFFKSGIRQRFFLCAYYFQFAPAFVLASLAGLTEAIWLSFVSGEIFACCRQVLIAPRAMFEVHKSLRRLSSVKWRWAELLRRQLFQSGNYADLARIYYNTGETTMELQESYTS